MFSPTTNTKNITAVDFLLHLSNPNFVNEYEFDPVKTAGHPVQLKTVQTASAWSSWIRKAPKPTAQQLENKLHLIAGVIVGNSQSLIKDRDLKINTIAENILKLEKKYCKEVTASQANELKKISQPLVEALKVTRTQKKGYKMQQTPPEGYTPLSSEQFFDILENYSVATYSKFNAWKGKNFLLSTAGKQYTILEQPKDYRIVRAFSNWKFGWTDTMIAFPCIQQVSTSPNKFAFTSGLGAFFESNKEAIIQQKRDIPRMVQHLRQIELRVLKKTNPKEAELLKRDFQVAVNTLEGLHKKKGAWVGTRKLRQVQATASELATQVVASVNRATYATAATIYGVSQVIKAARATVELLGSAIGMGMAKAMQPSQIVEENPAAGLRPQKRLT